MRMIAPVFHPRAQTSAQIETLTAVAMRDLARAEGHRPGRAELASRFRPLSDLEKGYVRLAQQKLLEGGNLAAIARGMGLHRKRLSDLLARAGIGRDGSEVHR